MALLRPRALVAAHLARALLERYIAAFEHADLHTLEQALREDAVLEMTPAKTG